MVWWALVALGVAFGIHGKRFLAVRWKPAEETWVALGFGLLAILLSAAMLPFGREARLLPVGILLRDVLMVLGCGLVLPTWYVLLKKRGSWRDLGLSGDNLWPSLAVGAATGLFISLGLIFSERRPALDVSTARALVALLAPGVFEAVLYYGFLQTAFAKAFGRLPAIVLGAALYSLHHIGFQLPWEADPAGKLWELFLVGVMMQSVTSITGNPLTYFPLAYLPGVASDVLLNPAIASRLAQSMPRGLIVLGSMGAWVAVLELTGRTPRGYDGNNRRRGVITPCRR